MNSNLDIVIAIVGSSIGLMVGVIGLFLWIRSEANSDRRFFQNSQENDRREIYRLEKRLEKLLKNRK
jgi:hypothetical protein